MSNEGVEVTSDMKKWYAQDMETAGPSWSGQDKGILE